MVLCMKSKKRHTQEIPLDDNFFLGRPDFSKFTPAHLPNFVAHRKIWLLSENLVEQTKINPLHQNDTRSRREDSSAPTTVVRCTSLHASTAQEKEEAFLRTVTSILSCVYAVFIVTLGVVIYLGELMAQQAPLAELFSIYLVVAGIAYLIFLYSDMKGFSKILKISEELFYARYGGDRAETGSGEESAERGSVAWASLSEPELVIPRHYCFTRGSHAGSFYLKLGAAGFCLGHLIHSGLLISYQLTFLIYNPYKFYECANPIALILDVIYPTYSFIQLFFIFKYSNVVINKHKILARFAIMHCISANVCFWIWTILRETVDSINQKNFEIPLSLHHVKAGHAETYSVMFVIWQNIGAYGECSPSPCHSEIFSNVVLHADCQSSNRGLFAGLIVLVGSFISIILFFVAMADRNYMETGLMVHSGTELILTILMTITVIPAYGQIIKLDVNKRSSLFLDDLLLFTCIPAYFVQAILSLLPSWNSQKYLNLASLILQVVQVSIQTPFIVDGLQRCANTKKLQVEKPGRELLMFLVVCNVTMWITETFEIKSHASHQDPRSIYYGAFIWSSITHLTFPLTMFYRFHSSVCMVDIWESAYTKAST